MSERLEVVITGSDGVSKTFVAVSRGAEQAGKSVEQAGKRGAQGMKELGREAQDSARKMDDIKAAATAVGAVFGVLATGAIKAGAAYKDQRLDLQSLESQYGSASDRIIDFTEVMQDSLNTSNDAARDMALTFATLYRNFDIGETQIQALMERTADISAARGRNAVEVSQMVQNALRGEAEYIEQIGVTLNDNFVAAEYAARGMGEWTKVTDEATKAAFRYQLLMEQTADTQGRAAEEAARAGGQFRLFLNELQDAGQTVGRFLGPVGEVAAEMAPIAMALPVVTAGLGRMVAAGRNSTLVMSALGAAFNPVTLGIAGLVAGGALVINSFREQGKAAEEYAASLRTLDETQEMLRRRGDESLANLSQQAEDRVNATRELLGAASDFETYLAGVEEQLGHTIYVGSTEYDMYLTAWDSAMQKIGTSADDTQKVLDKFNEAISDPSIDADAYLRWATGLLEAASQTETAIDDAAAVQTILNTELSEFSRYAQDAESSAAGLIGTLGEIDGAADGFTSFADAVSYLDDALADGTITMQDWLRFRGDLNRAIADRTMTEAEAEQAVIDYANAQQEATAAEEERTGAITAGADAVDRWTERAEAARDANEELSAAIVEGVEAWRAFNAEVANSVLEVSGNADITSLLNMTEAASQASILAEHITDVGAALDNTYRIVVGNTNAIGSQLQGLKDWSDALIGDPGVWAEIDDLYNEGRISLEKYTAAQDAQVTITEANATVQRDLLAIQAAQAPLLADSAENMADYVMHLRAMNDGINDTATGAQDQLAALALMDQGYQSQLLQVMELADKLDDLGPAGEEAFTSMIDGMVALDPAMAAVLEKVGLIDNVVRDQDGRIISYDVQIDGADGAMSEIAMLTASIDALNVTLGGTPPSYDIEVTGVEDVQAAEESVNNLLALQAQNVLIDVAWRLKNPEGDGTGGPAYDGPPVDVPIDLQPPDDTDWAALVPDQPVTVPVTLALDYGEASGEGVLQAAQKALGGANGEWGAAAISISVSQTGAEETTTAINDVTAAAESVPELEAVNLVIMGAYEGVAALDSVSASAQAIPEAEMVNVFVFGAYEAADALAAVANAANSIPEAVSTTVTTNFVTTGSPVNPWAHGGVVEEYASGGVVIRAGEVGPEIAHFPMGGTALLPRDGLYDVPAGTYISPHNAFDGYGGLSINVTVQGNVYGVDDLIEATTRAVAPALAEVAHKTFREQGVTF